MNLRRLQLCFFCLFSLFFVAAVNGFALEREAFTFTNYDLTVHVEPDQQRLGVRGKIILRNDSQMPQKIAVLQISSSLNWRSITANGKPLQFVLQPYTSDIDHTGKLSEAIVTLPEAIPPKGSVELEIGYEGVIMPDATRLTQLGTPEATARSADWDQISTAFTAVRGVGYVAWYPIATEAADLSEGANLFEVVGGWKARQATSRMHLKIDALREDGERPPEVVVNEASCQGMDEAMDRAQSFSADCAYQPLGFVVPTFAMANYEHIDRPAIEVLYLRGHDASATNYADTAEKIVPFIAEWFGPAHSRARTADLADADAAPFESGPLLLTPLKGVDPGLAGLAAAYQLTHAAFPSPRPWINEGLAHFAQALYVEHQSGRQAALDYMGLHRAAFAAAEKRTALAREDRASQSLANTSDEELYRSKAMYVWWMLRDMVGERALKKAIASYRPEQDKEPSYLQKLIQAQTQKNLEWFFDDWVYRDRGLPDFKVESAFPRKTMTDVYLVTVTVENLGRAGAEVPVTVKYAGGEVRKRLEVRGNGKAVIRVEITQPPEEIVVNDGSVPESDTTNNTFKIEASDLTK
jgi:hypothetical protein